MKILKSASCILIFNIACILFSCSKNKPEKPAEPTEEGPKKIFLPLKLESDNQTIYFDYIKNTALVAEVSSSDGYSVKMIYDGLQLIRSDKYQDNTLFNSISYIKNTDKELLLALYDVKGVILTPTGSITLKQNDKGQIIALQTVGKGPSYPYRESSWSYTPSGNVADITVTRSSVNAVPVKYTYDDKNGIFKNVPYAQLLFLEMGYSFFSGGPNNRLSCSNTDLASENTSFSYHYNADGYPAQITISKNQQTFNISYTEMATAGKNTGLLQ